MVKFLSTKCAEIVHNDIAKIDNFVTFLRRKAQDRFDGNPTGTSLCARGHLFNTIIDKVCTIGIGPGNSDFMLMGEYQNKQEATLVFGEKAPCRKFVLSFWWGGIACY